ncbi:branched-chain amino acid transport system II carrier protein [Lacticaseibacillus baoqingensis]|uniref:Branched-chain amino acid transport system carrier protein n=1 Tax=Lacticaseibacillus baoqingensis TaxID=2486013 RepID=A0ABW4E5J5_9LACO|nr:branched-chain amino acid transport system II carrier protein [Lacticaseibacillus baoqingensis]
MTDHHLTRRERLFIGTMLFGLFFGAGNLIFPVFVGQEAGHELWPALIGFLVSGVGLPLLGVAAIGITKVDGVFELAQKVNRPFAYGFTILLYLCIGPLFALPRLASISFEIGLTPFVTASRATPALWGYSVLFFAVAWWLARKPGKIMVYVGKVLTPAFLVVLAVLLGAAVLAPMGNGQAAHGAYQAAPLVTGFTAGYSTMDALAALAFGIIVVNALRELGVTKPTQIAKDTVSAGVLAVALMGVIYALLAVLGRNALGTYGRAANGGVILANVAHAYFGQFGNALLAVIVIIACLKTAIGLITAFGDTAQELFPALPYQGVIFVAALIPLVFANIGLDRLLLLTTPVLVALYPLAIVLILLALASPWLGQSKWVFNTAIGFTVIPALLDGLNAIPASLHTGWVKQALSWGHWLPGFSVSLGWIVPAVVGVVLGWLIGRWRQAQH